MRCYPVEAGAAYTSDGSAPRLVRIKLKVAPVKRTWFALCKLRPTKLDHS